tara:strand:- start:4232 stop:4516 length:285 start_codon:yes stop_codon:yes gene_type:complete
MKLIPLVELEIKDWLGMMDHIRLYNKGGWGRTPKTINIYQSPSEKIVHIQSAMGEHRALPFGEGMKVSMFDIENWAKDNGYDFKVVKRAGKSRK